MATNLATIPGQQVLFQLRQIQANTPGWLTLTASQLGDLVFFDVPGQPAYLVNHPDAIRHILQENSRNYSKDTFQYNALARITGRGLLTADGDIWFRNRRLQQPAFARPHLMNLAEIVVPATQAMLKRWEAPAARGEALDIDREMMRLTLEVVGKALFSIDLSQDAHALTSAVMTTLDHIVYQARTMITPPLWVPTPRNLRFKRDLAALDRAVNDIIRQRAQENEPKGDLLGMLLQARDAESGQPLSATELRDEVITLLIAGHETVASALTWSWSLLAQHPQAWEQLRGEVNGVLGEQLPTAADLDRLPYSGQIFSEALRLYPPAWLITRRAIQADEILGTTIAPRALVIISPYAIHRHPEFWKQPESFDPQRFAPEQEAARARYAYVPFGGGPRLCIGSNFAQIEARLILAQVAQRYRLELDPGQKVEMEALVTLRPRGGLPMRVRAL